MRSRLLALGAKPSAVKRYLETYEEVQPYLSGLVLDVGERSAFTTWLEERSGLHVTCTGERELREPLPFFDGQFDLVIFTEVLEHLRDTEETPRHEWQYTGMLACLRELRRVGRRLFLSTPNVCSYRSIQRQLSGRHPFEYKRHVRELSPRCVSRLLSESGWNMISLRTSNVWGGVPERVQKALRLFATRPNLHGDVIYAHAD
jgi:hypothetical protein